MQCVNLISNLDKLQDAVSDCSEASNDYALDNSTIRYSRLCLAVDYVLYNNILDCRQLSCLLVNTLISFSE